MNLSYPQGIGIAALPPFLAAQGQPLAALALMLLKGDYFDYLHIGVNAQGRSIELGPIEWTGKLFNYAAICSSSL